MTKKAPCHWSSRAGGRGLLSSQGCWKAPRLPTPRHEEWEGLSSRGAPADTERGVLSGFRAHRAGVSVYFPQVLCMLRHTGQIFRSRRAFSVSPSRHRGPTGSVSSHSGTHDPIGR